MIENAKEDGSRHRGRWSRSCVGGRRTQKFGQAFAAFLIARVTFRSRRHVKKEGSKKVWHEFISAAVLRGGRAADDVITTTRLSSRLCTRSVNRLRW